MTIYADLGEVNRIGCIAEPEAEIVGDGEILSPIHLLPVEGRQIPENCPREGNFDVKKDLGCVSCSYAFIDYAHHGIADC